MGKKSIVLLSLLCFLNSVSGLFASQPSTNEETPVVKVPLFIPLCSVDNHGNHQQNYENGSLYDQVPCVNGKPNGMFVKYYPDGNTWEKGYYKNGRKEGSWIESYSNGAIRTEMNYFNGLQEGVSRYYGQDGKLISEENFLQGKALRADKDYDGNGKAIAVDKFEGNAALSPRAESKSAVGNGVLLNQRKTEEPQLYVPYQSGK